MTKSECFFRWFFLRNSILAFAALLIISGSVSADQLSLDQQREIIQNYMIVTGQVAPGAAQSIEDEPCTSCECGHCKCGTQALLDFTRNYQSLDPGLLKSMGAVLVDRPALTYNYDSPGGWVRIHYERTGSGACWEPNVDTDGDGVPNYIETLALASDSIMDHFVNDLGYPMPIDDSPTPNGGDSRTDVYLIQLPAGYYGQTWGILYADSSIYNVPAWVEIDHNFQHLPEYVGRALDAARVTLAHELFHTIHFAMDVYEDAAWREMSAVWMEEHVYDDINDYYLYGPFFFDYPLRSLQSEIQAHNYASVLYPLYLSQNYGDSIILDIWNSCGASRGLNFLPSADSSIKELSDSTSDFYQSLTEFAVWNFFTGPYSDQAPNDFGYEEKESLDYFELEDFQVVRQYPVFVPTNQNPALPQYNGSAYLRLENLEAIQDHTPTRWFVFGDNFTGDWGISAIYQLRDIPDSHIVVSRQVHVSQGGGVDTLSDFVDALVGVDTGAGPEINIDDYRSITLVFTPSTIASGYYLQNITGGVGYAYSLRDTSQIDPALVNRPAGVLSPYPNPAVVSTLGGEGIKFRFQMATDETSYPVSTSAHLVVDLFTVAGERIRSLSGTYVGEDRSGDQRSGVFEVSWDMRNEGGDDVASGAYLAYARLYEGPFKRELLAEDHVKVAVIR